MNPVFNDTLTEIDYEPQLEPRQSQVSESLGFEDRIVLGCCFAFDNHQAFDHDVDAQRGTQGVTLVRDRETELPRD